MTPNRLLRGCKAEAFNILNILQLMLQFDPKNGPFSINTRPSTPRPSTGTFGLGD